MVFYLFFLQFKRMLNRELNHFSESGKSSSQVSDYIFSTFMGEDRKHLQHCDYRLRMTSLSISRFSPQDNNLDMEGAASHGKSTVNRAASISSASGLMESNSIKLILLLKNEVKSFTNINQFV